MLVSIDLSPFKMIVCAEDDIIAVDVTDYTVTDEKKGEVSFENRSRDWTIIGSASASAYKTPRYDVGVIATIEGADYMEISNVIATILTESNGCISAYNEGNNDYVAFNLFKYLIGQPVGEEIYNMLYSKYPSILDECKKASNQYRMDTDNIICFAASASSNNTSGTCTLNYAYLNLYTGKFTYIVFGMDTQWAPDYKKEALMEDDLNMCVEVSSSDHLIYMGGLSTANTYFGRDGASDVQEWFRAIQYKWSRKLLDTVYNLDKTKLADLRLSNVLTFGIDDESRFYITVKGYPVLNITNHGNGTLKTFQKCDL